MPDALPPVPVSQTHDGGTNSGTITFSEPLDQSVVLDPADFFRGRLNQTRAAVSVVYDSPTTLAITYAALGTEPIVPNGWGYTGSPGGLVGENGLPVADFDGFTG